MSRRKMRQDDNTEQFVRVFVLKANLLERGGPGLRMVNYWIDVEDDRRKRPGRVPELEGINAIHVASTCALRLGRGVVRPEPRRQSQQLGTLEA